MVFMRNLYEIPSFRHFRLAQTSVRVYFIQKPVCHKCFETWRFCREVQYICIDLILEPALATDQEKMHG